MSLVIRATGISEPDNNKGYLDHATTAAQKCIESAGVALDEIDLMINVGVYRDNNMCEPSVAAMIQHYLGINLNPISSPVRRTTFSFDLMNGACGMLNALQVASAILSAKGLERALLVSGDSHPSTKGSEDFPISQAAAALLVERNEQKGFSSFTFRTTPKFSGQSGFVDLDVHGINSRQSVLIETMGTVDSKIEFTSNIINRFLSDENISKEDIQLIISHPNIEFANEISSNIGVDLSSSNSELLSLGDSHTANLGLGAHLELSAGEPKSDLLFVTVGTGFTVGCGLYRK